MRARYWLGILCLLGFTVTPALAQTDVLPGWNLYETVHTELLSTPFLGVPIGSYSFGAGSLSDVNVGDTDTIIQRLNDTGIPDGSGTGTPTVNLVIDDMQLESYVLTNINGGGLGYYFITLQSARGGPASTGSMSVSFTSPSGGTFSSSWDIFYDVRYGSLNGPIVESSDNTFSQSGALWSRTSPPGAAEFPGINYMLNGTDTTEDFWPVPPLDLIGNFAEQTLTETPASDVPEPVSLALLLAGAGFGLGRRRRSA
jgi:hypothetical protein